MHSAYTQREKAQRKSSKRNLIALILCISQAIDRMLLLVLMDILDVYVHFAPLDCVQSETMDHLVKYCWTEQSLFESTHTHICIMLQIPTNSTVHQARQSKNIWNIEEVSIVSPIHMDIALKNQMAFVIWAGIPDQNHTHKLIIKDIKVQHNHKQNGLNQGPSTK